MKIWKKWIGVLFLFSSLFSGEGRSKYFIAIKEKEGKDFTSLETYTPFLPPKGKFYADPFLLNYKGMNYLFFEDYDYKKGVISYVILDRNQVVTKPEVALELSTHLSFPFIFQEGEEVYMTPETYRYRAVYLYKATQFPYGWKRERVLVQGEYFSDPILFKYDGYYWLFVAIHMDQLAIYYATDLKSQFFPHPMNHQRIKGRNAGNIFFKEGRMIRPTMDCSIRYGRSMILKEIVLLTKSEFIEKEINLIEPNWAPGLVGTHTYSQNEDYLVYDGERFILPYED